MSGRDGGRFRDGGSEGDGEDLEGLSVLFSILREVRALVQRFSARVLRARASA